MVHVIHNNSTHRARTSKRTSTSDSAHRIGLSTLLNDVLTVEKGVYGWMFKNHKIGHVFHHISTHRARTSKRSSPSDSPHRIGLSMHLQEVLTRVRGHASPDLRNKLQSGKSVPISFQSVKLREPRR